MHMYGNISIHLWYKHTKASFKHQSGMTCHNLDQTSSGHLWSIVRDFENFLGAKRVGPYTIVTYLGKKFKDE